MIVRIAKSLAGFFLAHQLIQWLRSQKRSQPYWHCSSWSEVLLASTARFQHIFLILLVSERYQVCCFLTNCLLIVNGKENVTILQLLTHTAGFDADPIPPLWTG